VSVETKAVVIPADTTSDQIDVMCPTGTVAVSGGLQTTDDNGFGELVSSWQSAAGTWSFVFRNDASGGGDDIGMTFSAVCLAVTPEPAPVP
jgi:hypothetical protein